jgi:hypothetical protein
VSAPWIDIPPHTVWGWVFEVAVIFGILWAGGFGIVVLVGWVLAEPWPQSEVEKPSIAVQEQHEAQRAALEIKELYRRAVAEVKRSTR